MHGGDHAEAVAGPRSTGRPKYVEPPAASPKVLCRPPGGVNAGHKGFSLSSGSAGIVFGKK
jgi:hypothetical protein